MKGSTVLPYPRPLPCLHLWTPSFSTAHLLNRRNFSRWCQGLKGLKCPGSVVLEARFSSFLYSRVTTGMALGFSPESASRHLPLQSVPRLTRGTVPSPSAILMPFSRWLLRTWLCLEMMFYGHARSKNSMRGLTHEAPSSIRRISWGKCVLLRADDHPHRSHLLGGN